MSIEHDWHPIDPIDDPALMCTKCLSCRCCGTYPPECPGEWVEDEAEQ